MSKPVLEPSAKYSRVMLKISGEALISVPAE